MFRRLSVFAGEFALEAAEAVCASDDLPAVDVLDVLTRLVDTSLVVAIGGDRMAWYHLLEPVRQYAMGHLEAYGETVETRRRHGHAYLAIVERVEIELRGPRQDVWLSILERE